MPYSDPQRRKEYQAAYREAHREQLRASASAYWRDHRDVILEKSRTRYAANAERYRAEKRDYRAKFPACRSCNRSKSYKLVTEWRLGRQRSRNVL